ncbi:MAG: hypothetical protein FWD77_01525 [Betaproteobacteria bacterium]|nr:hypothetical protein [Betaproteobacteria bacterium]
MTVNIDHLELEIPCPSCGQEAKQTIGRLKQSPVLICRAGHQFEADPESLRKLIQTAQENIDRLARNLSKTIQF